MQYPLDVFCYQLSCCVVLSLLHQGLSRATNVRVLAMVAVPEVSAVIVSTTLSTFHMQIWCFEDRLEGGELVIQQVLDNPDLPPV